MAKVLAKQVSNIGFVIHDQNACATRRLPEGQAQHSCLSHWDSLGTLCPSCGTRAGGLEATRQPDSEFGELADPAIDPDCAAMLLGHDVVANREAKAGSFSGRLGREERLKELVLDFGRNPNAIVADVDFDRIAEIPRRDLQGRLEFRVASLPLAFGSGIEAIAD
jgi:hypothetical protein